MMSFFLNPFTMLAGALTRSTPILIHLINRMRFRRVKWAAMEFLLKAQKRMRRQRILEQLILLLLRCRLTLRGINNQLRNRRSAGKRCQHRSGDYRSRNHLPLRLVYLKHSAIYLAIEVWLSHQYANGIALASSYRTMARTLFSI